MMQFLNKVILFISTAVVGCTTMRTPIGPTCVSCKPYYCRGSWHYPQTYYEYNEIGLASWYGDDFHGKSKATGEPFNKNAFTAAHKTLPIPSIVRVTNLRNRRSIIVLIDDRGPFCYEGRIIDLSYGAARALDIHRFKPSMVRVECLVTESLKLSQYIAKNCRRKRDPKGRTWLQLYNQEIAKTHPVKYYNTAVEKRIKTSANVKSSAKKYPKHTKKIRGKMDKFLNRHKI